MEYLITFLEGMISFVSPCLLPMLPIYISYFAGGRQSDKKGAAFRNACGFVLGFSIVFLVLGAFAGTVGSVLHRYQTAVNVITGMIVIFFGLHFLGVFKIKALQSDHRKKFDASELGVWQSVLFGMVFSIGWTPCVGAFLGSALMLASQQGSAVKGMLLLLCYSLGLGIPFLISALILEKLKGAFQWVKSHYQVINVVCGCFLIVIGICMMTGMLSRFLTSLM